MFYVVQMLDNNRRQSVCIWSIVNHVCVVWVAIIILCGSLLLMANMENCGGWWKVLVMVEGAI